MRWTPESLLQGEAALNGKSPSPFLNTVDELVDLRGLEIVKPVNNAWIKSFDLSAAKFERFGQFENCKVENTSFVSASLQTNIGGVFDSCNFSLVKATGAILRGMYSDCDFSLANLASTRGNQLRFVRCKFFKTDFCKAILLHCSFEDCLFDECNFRNASLSYSKFFRSPIPADDLKTTLIEKVNFM